MYVYIMYVCMYAFVCLLLYSLVLSFMSAKLLLKIIFFEHDDEPIQLGILFADVRVPMTR